MVPSWAMDTTLVSPLHADGARHQCCSEEAKWVAQILLSWRARLVAGSQRRIKRPFGSMRERRHGLSQNHCALGLVSLGPTVGAPSCLVPQPRRLLRRCSGTDGDIPYEANVLGVLLQGALRRVT